MNDSSVPRDSRRVPLETRVQLKFDRFAGFISEFSSNISPGGMFVKSESPEPVGTVLGFEFRLGDGFELIRGTGEVAWVRTREEGAQKPAGMGIRFRELSPQGRDLIYRIVDAYIQEGGTPFELTKAGIAASAPAAPPAGAPPLRPRPPGAVPPIRSASSLLSLFEEEAPNAPPIRPATPAPPATAAAPREEARPAPPPAAGPAPAAPLPTPVSLESLLAGAVPPLPPAAPLDAPAATSARPATAPRTARRWGRLAAAVLAALLVAAALGWRYRDLWWVATGDETLADPLPAAFSRPGKGRPMAPPTRLAAARRAAPEAPAPPPAPVPAAPEATGAEAGAPSAAPATAEPLPPATPPRPVLSRIERITWSGTAGETEVVLWGDGIIRPPNYARFRVEGGTPRELIKLKGIRRPFSPARLEVGTPEVVQVRVGYHAPSELHVVLDLADPRVELAGVEEGPTELRLRLRRE